MSIKDEIRRRYEEGGLYPVSPTVASDRSIRQLFVTEEINELLNEDDARKPEDIVRFSRLKADFDLFLCGEITVSFEPYKKPNYTFMALTDPVNDALWDIRSRDPRPAVRVLGGFAQKNVFICLDWSYRSDLGGPGSRQWRDFIVGAKVKWRQLFNGYNRVDGTKIDDYFKGSCTLV